ncbi:hypothetical protein LCGC14_1120000 [marine sediment metagenome]|uniref:Uncharacterized protein n=1 Tax=marine sediment metagenome TaxID=412755 RepID=A0A0F9M497_9ZZZZ
MAADVPKEARPPIWSRETPVYTLLELGCKAVYEVWRYEMTQQKRTGYFIRINSAAEYDEMMKVAMENGWRVEYQHIYDYPGGYYDWNGKRYGEMVEKVKLMLEEMKIQARMEDENNESTKIL